MTRRFLLILVPYMCIALGAAYLVARMGLAIGIVQHGPGLVVFTILSILFPILFVVIMLAASRSYSSMYRLLYIPSAVWLAIVFYLLIATFIFSLILPFISRSSSLHILGYLFLGLGLGTLLYGILHARKIQVKKYTVTSSLLGRAWQGKKIVFFSDTHLGLVWQEKFLKKIVRVINDQHPDIIVFGGDLVDGPVFPYERVLAPLAELHAPQGVFYTPGNHEGYNRHREEILSLLASSMTVLIDKKVIINGVQLIGLAYESTSPEKVVAQLKATSYQANMHSIVVLHDPKHAKALQEIGVSLVLSGHTHGGGQFWPLTHIGKSIYRSYAYGITSYKESVAITSSGVGTAILPIRIGTDSEIVVVDIQAA